MRKNEIKIKENLLISLVMDSFLVGWILFEYFFDRDANIYITFSSNIMGLVIFAWSARNKLALQPIFSYVKKVRSSMTSLVLLLIFFWIPIFSVGFISVLYLIEKKEMKKLGIDLDKIKFFCKVEYTTEDISEIEV
ncbi:hypothetical protein [Spiroplasma chinense]|nr:hypothetical protein [Spiroplasma chinense]